MGWSWACCCTAQTRGRHPRVKDNNGDGKKSQQLAAFTQNGTRSSSEMEAVWDKGGIWGSNTAPDDFGVNLPKRCRIWSTLTWMLLANKKCQDTAPPNGIWGLCAPFCPSTPQHPPHSFSTGSGTVRPWSILLHRERSPSFLLDITKTPRTDGVRGLCPDSGHEDPEANSKRCQLWH